MKISNLFKKNTAAFLCSIALVLAQSASSMCVIFLIKEPKMPKSLYIRD
jgi:hypothetical protein